MTVDFPAPGSVMNRTPPCRSRHRGDVVLTLLAALPLSMAVSSASRAQGLADAGIEPAPVVVLHGLARSSRSMAGMARALSEAGFTVCNISYPSTQHDIATLASEFVAPEIARCFPGSTAPLNFVTHSLGGIIARHLAASGAVTSFGRVVMLSPPSQGSEVVDRLGRLWLFRALNGPAGGELGTAPDSVPNRLGPARFTVGIIAGRRSINPLLSALIPGPDDGKVAIERARLDGMADFIVVPASHPFIMNDRDVIRQTIRFLQSGSFEY
jgi:pimeloyl-ACP methyl ester carboxylesterase